MTTGEKLSRLRKDNNYTQEQLADILGVSRQSVSKWESDIAFPETEKLIKISELFDCSVDYLLKENSVQPKAEAPAEINISLKNFSYEWKSKKTVNGVPLVHINYGIGRVAKGVIAIGLTAKGIVSLGFFSLGVISFGFLSLGLLSIGLIALGIISAGTFSAGILSFGCITLGVISVGAVAGGEFAIGALARGNYLAIGDHAAAQIAIGKTEASGSVYEQLAEFGKLSAEEKAQVFDTLKATVPAWLKWALPIVKIFM